MNKRHVLVTVGLVAVGGLAGFGIKALADGIPSPNPLYYTGTLTEGGTLVNGMRAITVNLWPDGTTMGSPLCTTVASTASVVDGRFRIALASTCKTVVNQNNGIFVEVIDGATSMGRSAIGAVPYAVEADHAVNADNTVNATNGVPSGAVMSFNLAQCPTGWTAFAGAAGRVVVGTSSALTLGATVGSDQVSLTIQEMPSHSHGITDVQHSHGSMGQDFVVDHYPSTSTGYGGISGGSPNVAVYGDTMTNPAFTGIAGTNAAGGGQPFDNRQASVALLYCQKN